MTPEQLIGIVEERIKAAGAFNPHGVGKPVTLQIEHAVAMLGHYQALREWGHGLAVKVADLEAARKWYNPALLKPDASRMVIVEWVVDAVGTRMPVQPPRMELMMMGQFMLDNWEDRSNWIKRWCYCPMPPGDQT